MHEIHFRYICSGFLWIFPLGHHCTIFGNHSSNFVRPNQYSPEDSLRIFGCNYLLAIPIVKTYGPVFNGCWEMHILKLKLNILEYFNNWESLKNQCKKEFMKSTTWMEWWGELTDPSNDSRKNGKVIDKWQHYTQIYVSLHTTSSPMYLYILLSGRSTLCGTTMPYLISNGLPIYSYVGEYQHAAILLKIFWGHNYAHFFRYHVSERFRIIYLLERHFHRPRMY